jgi:hypothetical protein
MYIFVIIYDNKYIKIIKVTIFLVGVKGLMSIVQAVAHVGQRDFHCLYFIIIYSNKILFLYTVEDFNPHSG